MSIQAGCRGWGGLFNSTIVKQMSDPSHVSVRLRNAAMAAIAEVCETSLGSDKSEEAAWLRQVADSAGTAAVALIESLRNPAPDDARLVKLARELSLSSVEILAVALACALEEKPIVGRVLAHMQAPVGGSRPTLGLMSHAFAAAVGEGSAILPALVNGVAVQSGLLVVLNEAAPLPERPVMVPAPLCFALAGRDAQWPGATIGLNGTGPIPLPDSVRAEAKRQAAALDAEAHRGLVLRTGSPTEGRSIATEIAAALQRRPIFIDSEKVAGLGPMLLLRDLLPVFCLQLGPGERRVLPELPCYHGPIVAVSGPDGAIETARGAAASWIIPVPSREERAALWRDAVRQPPLAERLAREHRHGAGRIAHLGRLAQHRAELSGHAFPHRTDVIAASWTGEGSGLDALAEPLRAHVPDAALVAEPRLRAELDALILRCRMRDELVAGLGVSATTRYRPGVRALFTGPSGTGKTLAAGWIATRLGLPLYRVDLASVTSKYIGETEKNLAQLLARAEQAEVILFFDEADSLFGKRTDITDSNDRFANAQTNYLLQRIENYDGIVLLTSNSQARFDTAFARRIDFVIEFSQPGPEERRAIWLSHLGSRADLGPNELNQLAALIDFTGGHIRNAVLAAAVRARAEHREVAFRDVIESAETELRKLGRQLPVDLKRL
jgi:hypothetical protein